LKYRDRVKSCDDFNGKEVEEIIRSLTIELEQFNLWISIQSISKEMRKMNKGT
jgi:hypothetical protein